jgi:hypothetical protein
MVVQPVLTEELTAGCE